MFYSIIASLFIKIIAFLGTPFKVYKVEALLNFMLSTLLEPDNSSRIISRLYVVLPHACFPDPQPPLRNTFIVAYQSII